MRTFLIALLATALIIPSIAIAEDETLAKALVNQSIITDVDFSGSRYSHKLITDEDGDPAYDIRCGCTYTGTNAGLVVIQCEYSKVWKVSALPGWLVTAYQNEAAQIETLKKTSIGLPTE